MKPCGGYLLTQNCIRLTHGLEAVTGDSAGASYAETRAGEGLAIDHAVGQAERLADDTNLVLVQKLDRLNELKLQVLRQTADIVVRLNAVALKNVGIYRALCEELNALKFAGLLFEHTDKLRTDYLALCLGIIDTGELIKEAVDSVDIHEVCVHLITENLNDLLGLALAQQTVIHMHAGELLADGLD